MDVKPSEEREVSWSRQHHSRTGPSRKRGCKHRSHNNLQHNLADRRMANPMNPVLSHHTSQERQPAAVPELPNNKRISKTVKVYYLADKCGLRDFAHFEVSGVEMLIAKLKILRNNYCGTHFAKDFLDRIILCSVFS